MNDVINRIMENGKLRYLCLSLILMMGLSCGDKEVDKKVERIRPVKYMTVSTSELSDKHTFSGTTYAKEESNLSFRVAGKVNRIYVKVGQRVNRGDLIASLDAADYNIQLQQAISQKQGSSASEQSSATQIKSAEANFIAARSAYNRIEKLYENNSVSLSDFEQSKANYEAAEASFKAAKAQYNASKSQTTTSQQTIDNARNQVAYTRLTAPFKGVISNIEIEENELVNSGMAIVTLSSIGKPEVRVGIPQLLISQMKTGMKAQVRFSILPDQYLDATVSEVGYTATNGSTFPVTVDLSSTDDVIRPGMPADVTFILGADRVAQKKILVPSSAVGEDSKGRFVLLIQKETDELAIVKKQYVTIGTLRNNGFEINSGLSNGMLIATAGLNTLLEGDRVRI